MNTLTGIEAERVSQILRHAIDRLHILSYVPTQWDDDLAEGISCDPVLASIEKQWKAEEQLKLFDSMMDGGKDIAAVKQAHRATRATCWNLLVERDSLQILMNRPEVQSEDFLRFLRVLTEVKSQINDRMTTTVEEEASNRTILQDLVERERSLEESKEAIEAKLVEIYSEKDHVTFALDQTLKKLQVELEEISSHNTIEMDSVHVEMKDALGKASGTHELRIKQVEGLEKQTQDVVEKNLEEEHRLRKEKGRAESALNAKISQYDEDMDSRHKALVELKVSYAAESAEYAILKEYFDKIDSDLKRGSEEEELLDAVKKRHAFGIRVLEIAATKIQKIARGRMGRNLVAKILSKKKKSKKGGKGGKGGKKKKLV